MKRAIVLGAGMVGVSTALQLQRRGWAVSIVDRTSPGRETSYGNAGVIQPNVLNPYPMPRHVRDLMRIAFGITNTARYRKLTLPWNVSSLMKYWWHSAPQRYVHIGAAYAQLMALSAIEHQDFITDSNTENLVVRQGYRVLHCDPAAFEADIATANRFAREFGTKFAILSPAEIMAAETGLTNGGLGAVHWLDAWNVLDPGAMVQAYADLFVQRGGDILRGDAASLHQGSSGWSVRTDDGELVGDAAVVALGPWSPGLLKRFGYRKEMVRKRGYHQHYRGGSDLKLPLGLPIHGCFLSPTNMGIRLTTGAELTGPNSRATPVQLAIAERGAREFLDIGQAVDSEPWFGTRPCMPDMLPVIGRAPRHDGLWFNFGHGHQGFTLGPITGRLTAEMMTGQDSVVDPTPYRFDR